MIQKLRERLALAPSSALQRFRGIGGPSLRVGITFDGPRPPHWAAALVDFFGGLSGMETLTFTVTARPSATPNPPWLARQLYTATQRMQNPFDATQPLPGQRPAESIAAANCDVVVWLASTRDSASPPEALARNGVFTVAFGNRPQGIPFWDEVSGRNATSATTIFWHDRSLAVGRPVRQVETSTSQGLEITANTEAPLIATIRLLAGLCLDLQRDAVRGTERLRAVPEVATLALTPAAWPSALEMGRFIAKKVLRSARLRATARGREPRWFIAVRANEGKSIAGCSAPDVSGFRDLPLVPGSEQMADPFLFETDGRTYLLFEDVPAGTTRGRLACAEIFADGHYSNVVVILERDYHLSYPCVFESDGAIYMIPESCEADRVELYRFARFPFAPERVATPIEGLPLVDTTPIHLDGIWYFFTTTSQPFMESLLFWADRLEGPWRLHLASPISCSVRNSRGAGKLFWKNGRLFRPTQDCSVRYGYAMTVNEVTLLTPTDFAEHPVAWVPPSWSPGLLCTHTWNESSLLQVVDGIRLVRAT
jgi:hypothetical protein